MTPPHSQLITRLTDATINVLIGVLFGEEIFVPGISGPTPSATTFAERWSRRTGFARELKSSKSKVSYL